jgi:hypothetical protein
MARFTSGLLARILKQEAGHGGAALSIVLAVAGAAVLSVGLTGSSDTVRVAGAILMGLAIVIIALAAHEWVKRISARLDRMNPSDPEARPGARVRLEF